MSDHVIALIALGTSVVGAVTSLLSIRWHCRNDDREFGGLLRDVAELKKQREDER